MVKLMKKYAVAGPDGAMHESVDVASEGGFGKRCLLALKINKEA